MVTCDGCLVTVKTEIVGHLPVGWEKVYISGWIGPFHACSGSCKERIIKLRTINLVPRRPVIIVD